MAAMAQPRVLVLGGHGKIAMLLTPLLLARSWHVTSVIRNPEYKEEILKLGDGHKGKGRVDVVIDSLDDVKSDDDAQRVLDKVEPDFVVWSAGAAGKGGAQRTYAIDRDAAKHYIKTSVLNPAVRKFLMVSYAGSRRNRPDWFTDADYDAMLNTNTKELPDYHKAKVDADEYLTAIAHRRSQLGDQKFQAICLRPGTLTQEPATGKVALGKIPALGPDGKKVSVSRAEVAEVAAALLDRDDTRGWIDLSSGEEPLDQAIERIVRDKVDCIDGEDLEAIYAKAD